jgi:hypothetical protein
MNPYNTEHVPIADFLENDPNQSRILDDQLFCRYFFDTTSPAFNVLKYIRDGDIPKQPGRTQARSNFGTSTCICGDPYSPEDMNPARVMHWCPRPLCRQGYHRACLLENGNHTLFGDHHDLVCARIASSPDNQEPAELPDEWGMSQLPRQLMSLAAQPMVRGGAHGVAGNVAVVVHARRVVLAAFREESFLYSNSDSDTEWEARHIVDVGLGLDLDLDCWDDAPGFESWKDAVVETNLSLLQEGNEGTMEGIQMLVCPNCAGAV